MTFSNGGKKNSRKVRSEYGAGPTLVPLSGWPWPVRCFSVANTLPGAKHAGLALALQAFHRRDAHFADQIGILAEGFLDPAPARIARHIDHRRERLRSRRARGFRAPSRH